MPLNSLQLILLTLFFLFAASGLILYFVLRALAKVSQAELALLICVWFCLLAGFSASLAGQSGKELWMQAVFVALVLLFLGFAFILRTATERNAKWPRTLASALFWFLKKK